MPDIFYQAEKSISLATLVPRAPYAMMDALYLPQTTRVLSSICDPSYAL